MTINFMPRTYQEVAPYIQKSFNPLDYGFNWNGDWYEYDAAKCRKAAIAARNFQAKRLMAEGFKVRKSSHPGNLFSMGGIGSGKPHIELVETVYELIATR